MYVQLVASSSSFTPVFPAVKMWHRHSNRLNPYMVNRNRGVIKSLTETNFITCMIIPNTNGYINVAETGIKYILTLKQNLFVCDYYVPIHETFYCSTSLLHSILNPYPLYSHTSLYPYSYYSLPIPIFIYTHTHTIAYPYSYYTHTHTIPIPIPILILMYECGSMISYAS